MIAVNRFQEFCCLFTNTSFKHHHTSVTALHRCHGYRWKAIKPNNQKNIPINHRLKKNNSLSIVRPDCVKLNWITPTFWCYYAFRPVLPELLESEDEGTAVPRSLTIGTAYIAQEVLNLDVLSTRRGSPVNLSPLSRFSCFIIYYLFQYTSYGL